MIKRNYLIYVLSCLCFSFILGSCSDNDNEMKQTIVNITLQAPENVTFNSLSNVKLTLTEKNTGKVTTVDNPTVVNNTLSITLNEGMYNMVLEGTANYTVDNTSLSQSIRAYKESIAIAGEKIDTDLTSFFYSPSTSGFVFREIFFSGSLTPEGKQTMDQYFIIYNNSDKTLYADGLFIASSAFYTTDKQDYQPNIMGDAFTTDAIIEVPGAGTDHPIKPGASFIIAIDAYNFKEINTNSIDLSKADFEIVYSDPDMEDTDNPDVPNMVNLVGDMVIHNRGYRSFVLGKMDTDDGAYLKDYTYTCTWKFVFEDYSFDEEENYYKIPNTWIQDAVNLSVESEFQWIVTAPSLDMGWTYCGKIDGDRNRYGKSVQRKVVGVIDGIEVLQDTNNSFIDFNPETPISLK